MNQRKLSQKESEIEDMPNSHESSTGKRGYLRRRRKDDGVCYGVYVWKMYVQRQVAENKIDTEEDITM